MEILANQTFDSPEPNLKISFSMRTRKGKSTIQPDKVNQDSFISQPNYCGETESHLFGVYDGHGSII